MNINEVIVNIKFLGRKQVAQIGNMGLMEATLRIEKAPAHKDENVARISYQQLLPAPAKSDFVTINEATKLTKVSEENLRKLCRDGVIPCEKKGGKWSVHLPSLYSYLSKLPNQ
jgi:hypothetical protein